MGNVGWASAAAIALLTFAPVALASAAALDTYVVTVPPSADPTTGAVGTRGGYLVAAVVADVDGTVTLVNADLSAHDVVSDALGPTDNPWCPRYVGHRFCPLFASPLVGLGGEAVVEGTDQLVPGTTYGFFCSVHSWMTGTLVAV